MINKCKLYFSSDISFLRRVFYGFNLFLLMVIFIMLLVGYMKGGFVFFVISITAALIFFFLILSSFYDSVFYISTFEIDFENHLLKYRVKKYNKMFADYSIPIKNVNISIKRFYLIDNTYQLRIYHEDIKTKQGEDAGWNKDIFKEIVQDLNKSKGKKTYLSYVK